MCLRLKDAAYSFRDNVKDFVGVLGLKFFFFIIFASHINKGFIAGAGSGGLLGLPILFLLRSYTGDDRLNAAQMQVYVAAGMTPWAAKPLFGILADTISFGGYNKLPFIAATTYISIVCTITMAVMWPLSPSIVACLLFGIYTQVAVVDLLTEAKYSEKIAQHSDKGPDMVTFVWSGIFLCQILATLFTTFLLEQLAPNWIYLFPVLPFILFMYPVYNNWIGDPLRHNRLNEREHLALHDPSSDYVTNCCGENYWFIDDDEEEEGQHISPLAPKIKEEVYTPLVGTNWGKVRREKDVMILALLIGAISLITFILGIMQVPSIVLFVVSLVSVVVMIASFFWLVDPIIAKVQTFIIIQNICTLSLSTVTFFFYTDTAEQYPEGPHFSITFYVTVMGLVGSVCALIGNFTYQLWMKEWRYRSVFIFNNSIYIIVSLLNIVIYKRWNLLVGIPDWVFVLGAETFQDIIGAWTNIPATLIMSQLCPLGIESTVFAILAGSSNLGMSLSRYLSVFIMELLDITPSGLPGETAKFNNLWIASLISIIAPIIPLLLVPRLIPDELQTKPLLEVHKALLLLSQEDPCKVEAPTMMITSDAEYASSVPLNVLMIGEDETTSYELVDLQ